MLDTFVRPPLSQFPRSPSKLSRFVYVWAKQKIMDFASLVLFKISTKPSFFKGATFKLHKKQIIPTAKAMHSTMCEALARGDRRALKAICCTPLYSRLGGIIEGRPRGKRYGWELVRYNKTLVYPRVVDDKLIMMGVGMLARQAVVAIASRQRRVEYDDSPAGRGRVVPGSEKGVDLMEYVVLTSTINSRTNRQNEWLLYGTIKPTTLESYEADKATLAELERTQLEKYKV